MPEPLVTDTTADLIGHGIAVFNEARTHRYLLIRTWEVPGKRLVFVMLNPSTADAFTDDPTIRRVIGFARREGFGSIAVVNLFGLRATDPAALRHHGDPVGRRNDEFITGQCQPGWPVITAWGTRGNLRDRARRVTTALSARGADVRCLGTTKAGHPCHPLYLPADTPLVPYRP